MFNDTKYLCDLESFENAITCYDGRKNADDFIDWYGDVYFTGDSIVYYSNAIEFLADNDPSLNDSLELAGEYGFGVSDLNSETLANLLFDSLAREELYGMRDDIQAYFDNSEAE